MYSLIRFQASTEAPGRPGAVRAMAGRCGDDDDEPPLPPLEDDDDEPELLATLTSKRLTTESALQVPSRCGKKGAQAMQVMGRRFASASVAARCC